MKTAANVFLGVLVAFALVMLFVGALSAIHYSLCGTDGCYDDAVDVGRGVHHFVEDIMREE